MTTLTSKVNVTDIAAELTTRPTGALARERLLRTLLDAEAIEVDFSNKTITPSFADECIGKLAASIGLAEFKRRVKLLNLSEATKPLIRHVILARCGEAHT